MIRFSIIFVALYFLAVSIFAIGLKNENNRIFYHLCRTNVEQTRLKQQLWQKQIQVEYMLNPATISQKAFSSHE